MINKYFVKIFIDSLKSLKGLNNLSIQYNYKILIKYPNN